LHKAANAAGLRSRPIAAAINYVTGPASHVLHSQLKGAVWRHPLVVRDSLDLVRMVEGLRFDADEQIMLTAADVNAFYPSIQLERGTRNDCTQVVHGATYQLQPDSQGPVPEAGALRYG
jgi:hypothetical protein